MKRIHLGALAVAAALALACTPERPVPLTPRAAPQPTEQKSGPPKKDARAPVLGKRITPETIRQDLERERAQGPRP